MKVEYLRYEIDARRQKKFIEDYLAASKPLLSSPFALSFDICQCDEDPSQFILRIEWTSGDDHLKGFRGSPEFKEFFVYVKPYYDDLIEMRHYTRHPNG